MNTDETIREAFARMGVELTRKHGFTNGFEACSQYGYCLADGFETREQAETHTLNYYRERMNLITQ